jgi:hypothetical protein
MNCFTAWDVTAPRPLRSGDRKYRVTEEMSLDSLGNASIRGVHPHARRLCDNRLMIASHKEHYLLLSMG